MLQMSKEFSFIVPSETKAFYVLNSSDAHVNGIHLKNAGPVSESMSTDLPDAISSLLSPHEGWVPPSSFREEESGSRRLRARRQPVPLPSLIHSKTEVLSCLKLSFLKDRLLDHLEGSHG